MTLQRSHTVEILLAAVAFFVSAATLGVYLYQARMMRAQQHASVWPYLEATYSNVDDYRLVVRNKGVGPALVRQVEMTLDGKALRSNADLVAGVLGPGAQLDYQNSTLENRVLAPGEEVVLFRIPDLKAALAFQEQQQKHHFALKVTYASVYGDCWVADGGQVKALPPVDLHLF
ncbi:MAG TPA: hypothetical protein VFT46_10390 [Holophagaceae bacterium]|nr:hypothetical protein [Holophagaceae bacterium]